MQRQMQCRRFGANREDRTTTVIGVGSMRIDEFVRHFTRIIALIGITAVLTAGWRSG